MARAAADGVDRSRWRELAELGVFGPSRPETDGGAGLRLVDATIVFEELGRALVPGPLVASFLAGDPISDEFAGVVTGELVATLVEPRPRQPLLVEHLGSSDLVLVLRDERVTFVDAPVVASTSQPVTEPLDPTTPVWLADRLPPGHVVGDAEQAARWRLVGTVLTAALLLGVAQCATEMAVGYAKDRHQFGRSIGSFQALKHLMADMFARTEVGRAGLHAAALVADDPEIGDVERAVAGARVLAGEAAIANTKTCIQLHGGVGFTWEADPHLLYKRALLYETQFGPVDESAEIVAHRLTA